MATVEVGSILCLWVTTYYAASMEVGFVVTNSHCEVGSILCLLLELQLTNAASIEVGFVVTDSHCKVGSILCSLLGL